jgi:hypothetical protein
VVENGVDYSWDRPSPAALWAAGYRFVVRYLSNNTTGKNLTLAEAEQLHAAGLATVSNWEDGAEAARNGFGQGASDARTAAAQHVACGGPPNRPIYFSVDYDVPDAAPGSNDPAAKLGAVAAYYRGVASVIGLARTGAYGGYWTISRLFDAGLIRWGWQTFAWSGGRWDGRAHLRQTAIDVVVAGAACDIDESGVADFGQWGVDMEQTDRVVGYATRGNTVGDVLADVSNERDWWYGPPGFSGNNPPPAGSRADLLIRAAQQVLSPPPAATLSETQATALVDELAARLPALSREEIALAVRAALANS